MRRVLLATAMLVAAPAAGSAASRTGAPGVHSEVDGFRIAAVDALPAPRDPQRFGPGDFCRNIQVRPQTPAGRHAAGLGWYVTSEVRASGYTAVGIFSRGEDAPSGTCLVSDGNVVLYRGGRPVAIIYEPHADRSGGRIGGVLPSFTVGRLRISDWTPAGFAHADIVLEPRSVTVTEVAALEAVCGGTGLPNIRGMTLARARRALAAHGWEPADLRQPGDRDSDDLAARRRQAGWTELETCSGTGFGFCAARYGHPGGAVLDVTTLGEEPTVARYQVRCLPPAGP